MSSRVRRIGIIVAASAGAWLPSAILSAPASAAPKLPVLTQVSGIPRSLAGLGSLNFSLEAHNATVKAARPALSVWLSSGHALVALEVSPRSPAIPPAGTVKLGLVARLPASTKTGGYRLVVCAAAGKLRRPAQTGCVSSSRFSYLAAARIRIGAHPVGVRPTLDSARAASATIGSPGGTLRARASDGSKLVLRIPRNALAGNEQITLTPVRRLGRSGVTFLAGAQLAPAGLVLLFPAQLRISPAHSAPAQQRKLFGYQGTGAQFGLLPPLRGNAELAPVTEFGGFLVAKANDGQLKAIERRPPGDPSAAMLSQVAAALIAPARAGASAAVATPSTAVIADVAGGYNQIVASALAKSLSSLAAFRDAAALALGWERQGQLLGVSSELKPQEAQIVRVLRRATVKFWNQALARCNGESLAALEAVMEIGRQAAILGNGGVIGGERAIGAAIDKCSDLHLQLSLDGPSEGDTEPNPTASIMDTTRVSVRVPDTPLHFMGRIDDNVVLLQSPRVVPIESLLSSTVNPQNMGCSISSFQVSTNPQVTWAQFSALVTVSADLFTAAEPHSSVIGVTAHGADDATVDVSCPGVPSESRQSAEAMFGIDNATTAAPVELTSTRRTGAFAKSGRSLDGGTYDVAGTISVRNLG
jgi:hypothetical protein